MRDEAAVASVEQLVQFGPSGRLAGTLLLVPQGDRAPGVVFMSSGFASRSGPNRLNLRLARGLAEAGMSSIRFDYSGVGDSPRVQKCDDEAALRAVELGAAIDALAQRSGCERFLLVGLCASTDFCIAHARQDARVVGLVLLDPFSYANWKSNLWLLWRKLGAPGRGARLLLRLRRMLDGGDPQPTLHSADRAIWNELRPKPSREQFAGEIRDLLERGLELLVVHTSYAAERHNYEGQFADAHPELRGRANIRVVWMPTADHTYSRVWMKTRLFAALSQWLRDRRLH